MCLCDLIEAKWCIYVSFNYAIISADNGLSTVGLKSIVWTNAGVLLIEYPEINFHKFSIRVKVFPLRNQF